MLGAHSRVIQTGGHGVSQLNLSIVVRQQPGLCPLKYPQLPSLKPRRMLAGTNSPAAGFDANHSNSSVVQERIEKSNRIAAASDTCHQQIRQTFFLLKDLPSCFFSDDPVKIPNQHRIGMRAVRSAEKVMG